MIHVGAFPNLLMQIRKWGKIVMLIEILQYIFYFFAAVGILFGITSLSVLMFYSKNQSRCRSVILLRPGDDDAELILRSCIRADRLLSRCMPPVVIDCGLCGETLAVVQRLSQELDFQLIRPDELEATVEA